MNVQIIKVVFLGLCVLTWLIGSFWLTSLGKVVPNYLVAIGVGAAGVLWPSPLQQGQKPPPPT